MQKKLIAVAIAGLASAPAFAQTNVTVYGVGFLTVENVRASDATAGTAANIPSKQRVTSNSSRLGFRGTEELGNGLKALFQFETSVAADGGTPGGSSQLFGNARDSFVGVAGGFGAVKLGIHTSPFRDVGNTFDVLGQETIAATGNLLARVQSPLGQHNPGFRDRLQSAVKYESPDFAGFSFSGIYGANENKTEANPSGTNNHTYGVGLGYAAGPFKAKYAYERRNDNGASLVAGGPNEKSIGQILGGEFNFGMGRVGALWQRQKVEVNTPFVLLIPGNAPLAVNDAEVRQDAWALYAGFNLGNGELWANYADARKTKLDTNVGSGDVDNSQARQYGIGYNYNLSKRTKLMAFYTQIKNKEGAQFDYRETTQIGSTAAGGGVAAGSDPRGFAVGLRHVF